MKCFLRIIVFILSVVVINSYKFPCQDETLVPFPDPDGCESFEDAYREAIEWLQQRMPPWDKENRATLFGQVDRDGVAVDGLNEGIANTGVNLSLTAKKEFPWAWNIPKDIWYDYNLPYASVNEARNNWRPLISNLSIPLLEYLTINIKSNQPSIEEVVSVINGDINPSYENIWTKMGSIYNGSPIKFVAGQTPLIFDPMSIIAYGYASCTGISIVLIDALRSVGICARLTGTPAWHGNESEGNHNWLEVYSPDLPFHWGLIEGLPAGSGENISDPCNKWFCGPSQFGSNSTGISPVYAAHWNGLDDSVYYPLAW